MYRIDAEKSVHFCDGMSRRDFLHAGALATMGLTLPGFMGLRAAGAVDPKKDVNCIFLFLVGGPS
ncbi:MAG TPA: twin-arginine translocation signal domain-containing protein, partial [Candidatus Hydrogenedentes bacterium]|nr:twin-arginine translocation signal domain-containing protein [Candidatus Hydrogenedentota bacterium]